MRRLVVFAVLVLVSVIAPAARAADPTVVSATASPSTAAPGQPVRLTATLSEPAPAGGAELNLRISGDWYPVPRLRVVIPAGERTVTHDWQPPVGFRPFRDYLFQAYPAAGGAFASAEFRVNGLTDAGGYAVTAYDSPPTLVAGQEYPAVATINRAAPRGGLLLDRQQYGSYGPSIGAPRSVLVPEGGRRATVSLYAPTQDLIAAGRITTGIGLGFWSQPGGGPTFQHVDISPYVVPKWFSITPHRAFPAGTGTTLGLGLGGNANPDGTYVSLTSDNPAVVVPAQVFVPAGHSGVDFPVSVTSSPTSRAARITARWRGLLSTSDILITGTSLPEPAPTPTATPFPEWQSPDTTLTSGPTGEVSGPVTFTFTSNEPGSTFRCELESADGYERSVGFEPCTSPKTYSGLEPNDYRFEVQAIDPTGNVDPVGGARRFTITGPPRPVPAVPAFDAPASVTLPEVTVRGRSESGAQIEIVDRWAWNAPLWPARLWTGVVSPDGDWSVPVEHLTEGAHWLSVRAINRTGASPWSSTRQVTVDTSGTPTPTPTPTATPTATATPTPTATATPTPTATATPTSTPTATATATPSGSGCSATNGGDVSIPDLTTVESAITITGCERSAATSATVDVHIKHTYIGDLVVNLVAPDGTTYTLHNRAGGSTDDIDQTYTVNLPGKQPNGTWKLRVQDAAAADTGRIDAWTINLTASSTPCGQTNGTSFTIADLSTVESPMPVVDCPGTAPATAKVEVHIKHTYIGDLVVSLVAPDGSTYPLHNRAGGSTDDIDQTYTVDLSTEPRNGTWKLRVQDAAAADTGRIVSWTLTL